MIRVGKANIERVALLLPDEYKIATPEIVARIRADFEAGKPFHYLFTGGVGRGKTFLATIMSHSIRYAMIRLGISPNSDEVFDNIIHENVRKIYQRYLAIMGGNSSEKALDVKRLTGWVNRPVVLIDDVGAETPGTESAREWIGSLICDRYDAWKRGRAQGTIITTNLDYTQLRDTYGDRVLDRIEEMYTIMKFTNPSFRRQKREVIEG